MPCINDKCKCTTCVNDKCACDGTKECSCTPARAGRDCGRWYWWRISRPSAFPDVAS